MSTDAIARPVMYTIDDFNKEIAQEVASYDENGEAIQISYHGFFLYSEEILSGLLNRVRTINEVPDDQFDIATGKALLTQYDHFTSLVETIAVVAQDMFDWLNGYDGKCSYKSRPVMTPEDVKKLPQNFQNKMNALRTTFFTKGDYRGVYLANRIEKLGEKVKAAEEKAELSVKV